MGLLARPRIFLRSYLCRDGRRLRLVSDVGGIPREERCLIGSDRWRMRLLNSLLVSICACFLTLSLLSRIDMNKVVILAL